MQHPLIVCEYLIRLPDRQPLKSETETGTPFSLPFSWCLNHLLGFVPSEPAAGSRSVWAPDLLTHPSAVPFSLLCVSRALKDSKIPLRWPYPELEGPNLNNLQVEHVKTSKEGDGEDVCKEGMVHIQGDAVLHLSQLLIHQNIAASSRYGIPLLLSKWGYGLAVDLMTSIQGPDIKFKRELRMERWL